MVSHTGNDDCLTDKSSAWRQMLIKVGDFQHVWTDARFVSTSDRSLEDAVQVRAHEKCLNVAVVVG
jgi:hypothetical protein